MMHLALSVLGDGTRARGTVIRLDEADPAFNTWPTWDHPLGGPGRWGVVLRPLRQGIEVAPLVEGFTLPPRIVRAWVTITEHRARTAQLAAQAQQDYLLARKSGVFAEANLTPPPPMPAWLLRDLPR